MILLEIIASALLLPFTNSALALATSAALRGDKIAVGRWLRVWEFFHTPVEIFARMACHNSRRKPYNVERFLVHRLWRYQWYRKAISYAVANPFPFTQRPWPSFVRNGTPYYAVEYYWFVYVAQDWSSAQDALADATRCGWSVELFKVDRTEWEES